MASIQNPFSLEKPLKLSICYTETCNLSCQHCYADCSPEKASAELNSEEWGRFLDEIAELGVVYLYIEGGEPFHRPDFLPFLASASNRFFTEVRTNGTLITRDLSGRLKQIGVGIVLVDILSPHAEVHDYFTGTQGSHARACEAVTYLVEAGIETQLLTILNRKNVDALQGYIDLAQRLGVKTVGVLRPYPLGRFKWRWNEVSLSLDEMHAALELAAVTRWHETDAVLASK